MKEKMAKTWTPRLGLELPDVLLPDIRDLPKNFLVHKAEYMCYLLWFYWRIVICYCEPHLHGCRFLLFIWTQIIQARKRNPNPNLWVRISSGGVGLRGGGQKVRYVPRNPRKPSFWARYPGILPGYPGGARKVWQTGPFPGTNWDPSLEQTGRFCLIPQ